MTDPLALKWMTLTSTLAHLMPSGSKGPLPKRPPQSPLGVSKEGGVHYISCRPRGRDASCSDDAQYTSEDQDSLVSGRSSEPTNYSFLQMPSEEYKRSACRIVHVRLHEFVGIRPSLPVVNQCRLKYWAARSC